MEPLQWQPQEGLSQGLEALLLWLCPLGGWQRDLPTRPQDEGWFARHA